jgi:hypothetical protein
MAAARPPLPKRLLALVAAISLAAAGALAASDSPAPAQTEQANVTLTVVNSDGYPQPEAGVWVDGNGQQWWYQDKSNFIGPTYANGQISFFVKQPIKIRVRRGIWSADAEWVPNHLEQNPCWRSVDGPDGEGVLVEVAPGDQKTVTLPAVLPRGSGALTPYVLRTVYLINQERRNAGVPPVQISASLTRAADAYARHISQFSREFLANNYAHCLAGTSSIRGVDQGFGSRTREIIYLGLGEPERAVASWMKSPPHREIMLDAKYNVIGVGRPEGYYVAQFGICDGSPYRNCELTGSYGENVPVGDDSGDSDDGEEPLPSGTYRIRAYRVLRGVARFYDFPPVEQERVRSGYVRYPLRGRYVRELVPVSKLRKAARAGYLSFRVAPSKARWRGRLPLLFLTIRDPANDAPKLTQLARTASAVRRGVAAFSLRGIPAERIHTAYARYRLDGRWVRELIPTSTLRRSAGKTMRVRVASSKTRWRGKRPKLFLQLTR